MNNLDTQYQNLLQDILENGVKKKDRTGKVINRPKYITSLGKFIIFPVPTSLGAFIGYKLAYVLSSII